MFENLHVHFFLFKVHFFFIIFSLFLYYMCISRTPGKRKKWFGK